MCILGNDSRIRLRRTTGRGGVMPLVLAVALIACSTSGTNDATPAGGLTEGWIDGDTYRFVATGRSMVGTETAPESDRKRTACDAALLLAQARVIEVLADAGIKGISGTVVMTEHRGRVVKEIQGFLSGSAGTVVSTAFDPLQHSCRLVYEVRDVGLKKRVMDAAAKNAPPVSY